MTSIRTGLMALLAGSAMALSGCNDESEGTDTSNQSATEQGSNGEDSNGQGSDTTPDQLRAVIKEKQLSIAQFVYRRLYWNDLGAWGTTDDPRDAYKLAGLASLHNDYTTRTPVVASAEGDELSDLCPSSGGLVRTETASGGFLFTYDDCRWTTNFGHNRSMDGTVSLEPYSTTYSQGWVVGMDFDYRGGAQYEGEFTYEYNGSTDFRITNFDVTVQGMQETGYADVALERTPTSASFSGRLFSHDEWANDEDNGALIVSTDDIDKLDTPTRGKLIIEGADGDTLTVEFKSSGVDIQFNDDTPESYSDSAFDPRS